MTDPYMATPSESDGSSCAALDDLLLTLTPDVLVLEQLRALISRQQMEIAGHMGMAVADLFLLLHPETEGQQLQRIAQSQAAWLERVIRP